MVKSFVSNIIIHLSYNLSKYTQYKDVWKLFEVSCFHHTNTLLPCIAWIEMESCSKFLLILVIMYFSDRKWISKTVDCNNCLMAWKTIFFSELADIPDKNGRKQEGEGEHWPLKSVMRFTQTQLFDKVAELFDTCHYQSLVILFFSSVETLT